MQSKIIKIISYELNVPLQDISLASTLDDLGLDSLDTIEIVMELEHDFEIDIGDDEIKSFNTVKDIIDLVESKVVK